MPSHSKVAPAMEMESVAPGEPASGRIHMRVDRLPRHTYVIVVVALFTLAASTFAVGYSIVSGKDLTAQMEENYRLTSTDVNALKLAITNFVDATRVTQVAIAQALAETKASVAATQDASTAMMAQLAAAYNTTAAQLAALTTTVNSLPHGVRIKMFGIQVSGDDSVTHINYHTVPKGGSYDFDVGLTGNEKLLGCWLHWEGGWFDAIKYVGFLRVSCDNPNGSVITVSAANQLGFGFVLNLKIFGLIVAQ